MFSLILSRLPKDVSIHLSALGLIDGLAGSGGGAAGFAFPLAALASSSRSSSSSASVIGQVSLWPSWRVVLQDEPAGQQSGLNQLLLQRRQRERNSYQRARYTQPECLG